MMAYWGVEV